MKQLVIASVLLAACGGGGAKPAPATTPTNAAFVPPGACVVPLDDATARFGASVSPEEGVDRTEVGDLDGDSVTDVSYSHGLGFMVGNSVYIVRGACGHFVGEVGAEVTAIEPTRSHGLSDLRIIDNGSACEGSRCGCEDGYLIYRYDGTQYVEDAAASHPAVEQECAEGDGPDSGD